MTTASQLLANDPASKMLGIELTDIDDGSCSVFMLVQENMTNGYDICHGGFVYTLADTASAFAGAMEGETVLSSSNQIDYLLPAKLGDELTAKASINCISGRRLFCDVSVTNQHGKAVALMRSQLISKNTTA
ncbi:hotdog fold thioesterase [Aliikangiella coralliicola]|uniref:Hotdog fold thioesterase n=1 Tax=Aliikangiella coralliicola TaxID=2592383 RepID=A0A545TSQ4_9GAMM|nr:hotdog fold thioesterase [Aliikangiella coralliicola]TQV80253.1 hotdog fold thioesterase [Aliikangiella coralliicola]